MERSLLILLMFAIAVCGLVVTMVISKPSEGFVIKGGRERRFRGISPSAKGDKSKSTSLGRQQLDRYKEAMKKGKVYRNGSDAYEGYGWGGRYGYGWRPYRNWANYLAPSYYPYGFGGGYPYSVYQPFDAYNYMNPAQSDMCYARITIDEAFGPYTGGVMGKQAWLDWAGRNGFPYVWLDGMSVTNDHAIVEYPGMCNRYAQTPPCPRRYRQFMATQNWY